MKVKLIAICGKSATGKTYFTKWLQRVLKTYNINAEVIVSHTTRPMRPNEYNLIDYVFIDENQFAANVKDKKYIEWTTFNGWHYGTPTIVNKPGVDCYIGVFNAAGIKKLVQRDDIDLQIVYMRAPFILRWKRSCYREGWRHHLKERLRRFAADRKDFKNIENYFIFFAKKFAKVMFIDNNEGALISAYRCTEIMRINHFLELKD